MGRCLDLDRSRHYTTDSLFSSNLGVLCAAQKFPVAIPPTSEENTRGAHRGTRTCTKWNYLRSLSIVGRFLALLFAFFTPERACPSLRQACSACLAVSHDVYRGADRGQPCMPGGLDAWTRVKGLVAWKSRLRGGACPPTAHHTGKNAFPLAMWVRQAIEVDRSRERGNDRRLAILVKE